MPAGGTTRSDGAGRVIAAAGGAVASAFGGAAASRGGAAIAAVGVGRRGPAEKGEPVMKWPHAQLSKNK